MYEKRGRWYGLRRAPSKSQFHQGLCPSSAKLCVSINVKGVIVIVEGKCRDLASIAPNEGFEEAHFLPVLSGRRASSILERRLKGLIKRCQRS